MAMNLEYTYGSAVTISDTETSLATTGGTTGPQAKTDAGVYSLFLDGVANMVKGDEYLLRVYEKARTGGTQRVIFSARLRGPQTELFTLPNLLLGIGWDMTLQRVSANSRAFDWSLRRVS